MTYFDRGYVDYFKKLARNNEREWFHDNKKTYEVHVKEPFEEFVAEIIRPEGLSFAGGLYSPDTAGVAKVRKAMLKDGATFAKLLRAKAFKELYGELAGDKHKRLAPEFVAVVDRWPFIANKQFYYWAEYKDPKRVLSPDLVAFTMRHYKAGAKVTAFLRDAVS